MTGRGIDIKILIILSSTEQNSSSSDSSFASVLRITNHIIRRTRAPFPRAWYCFSINDEINRYNGILLLNERGDL